MNEAIEQILAERTGLDIDVLGPHAIDRAVGARMAACGISGRDAYVRLLSGCESELDNLVEELAVLETWFFRDRGPFDFLEQYARGREAVRVLSAACATGEEAYSIAIALLEAGLMPDRFEIDACDLSQRALQVASRAIYPASSFREDWHGHRERWFEPVAGGFALRPDIVRLVRFHRDDLLHPAFLAAQPPYDVVFCRNVLIYFRAEAQKSLLKLIGQLVKPEGVVITGHAEVGILLCHGYKPAGEPRSFACRRSGAAILPEPIRKTINPLRIAEGPPPSLPVRPPPVRKADERDQLLQRARLLADQGALEDAWSLCERVLAQCSDADAYYLEGVINAARDRLDLAEESFRRSLYLDPAHSLSLVQMSLLCERRGQPEQARLFRDRAARLPAVPMEENYGPRT